RDVERVARAARVPDHRPLRAGGGRGAGHAGARVAGPFAGEEEDRDLARRQACGRVVRVVGDAAAAARGDPREVRDVGVRRALERRVDVDGGAPGVRDERGEAQVRERLVHVGRVEIAADGGLRADRDRAGVRAGPVTRVAALRARALHQHVAVAVEDLLVVRRALVRARRAVVARVAEVDGARALRAAGRAAPREGARAAAVAAAALGGAAGLTGRGARGDERGGHGQ